MPVVDKAFVFELLLNDYEQSDEAVDARDFSGSAGLASCDCETVNREYGFKLVAHLVELGVRPVILDSECVIGKAIEISLPPLIRSF